MAMRAGIDPAQLTTIRATGTFLVMLLVALGFRRDVFKRPKQIPTLIGMGLIGVAALQWTYFVAINNLPVSMALLLEYQAPILVAIWAGFVQKKVQSRLVWVGLGLAIVGLILVTGILGNVELKFSSLGIAAGFAAAISLAGYFLLGEKMQAENDAFVAVFWAYAVAALVFNIFAPIQPIEVTKPASMLGNLATWQLPLGVALAWVTIFGTLVPFSLQLVGVRILGATAVANLAILEPIGVVILGWLWFAEKLSTTGIIGCFLVLAGVALTQSVTNKSPDNPTNLN